MKKYIPLLLLLICSTAHAEKVRVYTDYNPVRVMHLVDKNSDFDMEAEKADLKGAYKELEIDEIPTDRTERDAWKFKAGEVKPDSKLQTEIAKEKKKKTDALEKLKGLGFTDEDLSALGLS